MDWQPIKTAPRDGTDLDLWCEPIWYAAHRRADCYWSEGCWWAPNFGYEGEDGELPARFNPTHWMPLPEPPHTPANEVLS